MNNQKSTINHQQSRPRDIDRDLFLVAAVASALSLLSFLYYFQRGEILLYAAAAPADDPISCFGLDVANRVGRFDSIHDCVRSGRDGNFPAHALPVGRR